MYVCLCKGVTDHTIRAAVADGVSSMRELKQLYGVGAQCGCCTQCAKDVLTEALAKPVNRHANNTLIPTSVCYT